MIRARRLRPGVQWQAARDTAFGRNCTWDIKIDGESSTAFQSGVTATALQDASDNRAATALLRIILSKRSSCQDEILRSHGLPLSFINCAKEYLKTFFFSPRSRVNDRPALLPPVIFAVLYFVPGWGPATFNICCPGFGSLFMLGFI